ncbi:MAG: hypothetical protein IT507_11870 [Burkholderiaceae bacterium]|nr:hypothetical protein [Burkholderiaceae bacterium]
MMDFNSSASLSGRLQELLDRALAAERDATPARDYLGASRLGAACERQLQYEFVKAPVDHGKGFSGRMLRIFERGHRTEDMVIRWLRLAGFTLKTEDADGHQFGFSVADGRLRGHIDGVLTAGPEGFTYPALWENKCLGSKSWLDVQKHKLAASKPVYAAQIAIYQAYLNLHEHPALFTAVNADTMEIYAELIPFDAGLAQRMSDRAARVISATDAGELLARSFADSSHFECKFCAWSERCWRPAP